MAGEGGEGGGGGREEQRDGVTETGRRRRAEHRTRAGPTGMGANGGAAQARVQR